MAEEKKQKQTNNGGEKQNSRTQVSNKTILIIIGVVLGLILVGTYIYRWQQIKNDKKLTSSYLLDSGTVSLEIKNLEEVSQILSEAPNEYFILISYTKDQNTYNLEKGIKKIIDEYKLSDAFYYFNVDSIKDEDNYITRLNNSFNTDKIKKVPVILYYKDGKNVDVVARVDDNCINAGDFQKLLDIYEYEGQ